MITTPTSDAVFERLLPELQRAVKAEGYTTPTPIQVEAIPALLDGRDLLGCAPTGTGKTAAFVLPLLHHLATDGCRARKNAPRALVLAPTRELAAQIGDSLQRYGRYLQIRHTVIFGGVNQFRQVKALTRGVDVLIATPGRLLDLKRQGHLRLDNVRTFVLDEVDRMLDMGFLPDIRQVIAELPAERQTLFFSATLAGKVAELATSLVTDPVRVVIQAEDPSIDRITQSVLFVDKQNKGDLLASVLRNAGDGRVIIFTQMKHTANKVVEKLAAAGIEGVAIHGNKTQAARTKALDGFRRGRYRALVATDVAARGIDVDDITHVINYDLPVEAETYVHRIGRTARAGARGQAISFCCAETRAYLRDIERLIGNAVPADTDHPFHCDHASRSTQGRPVLGGGGGGRRGGGKGGFRAGPHPARRKRQGGGRPASRRV